MTLLTEDKIAWGMLNEAAQAKGLDIQGGAVRRTSSRFCFGVEHGDYNGTELFGIGTDRFVWFAYKPNGTNKTRLYSLNFPEDGVIEFADGKVPAPQSQEIADSWARFAYGVDYILRQEGYKLGAGIDGVIYGNIPGGGMSRSASLCLNLILTTFEVNGIDLGESFKVVQLAQAVENVYIGSPCGLLDQIMIYYAKDGMGTHYNPQDHSIRYIPLGEDAKDFRIVVMDTGTVRPGLEKSTYKVRRGECEQFAAMLNGPGYGVKCLAEVRDEALYEKIMAAYGGTHPQLCRRLTYIYQAQQRFYEMLKAWKHGDIMTLGRIFRADGLGLRDDYVISGPELETMCDLVRTIPGVYGERMLGGGDKGAAGAIVQADAVEAVKAAVATGYPRSYPAYADKYAVHVCKPVAGVVRLEKTGI